MAKVKRRGLGSVVSCDPAGGSTFAAVGMSKTIEPPKRNRAKIDRTTLDDDLATNEPGIEEHSEFKFMQLWDPDETSDEILDTLFDSKAEAAWEIEYPHGVTDVFDGWVSDLEPDTIEIAGMLARGVTVQRTSDITRNAAA